MRRLIVVAALLTLRTEQAVVDYAVAFPTHGQHRASNELRKQGVFISDSGVRSVWLLHNLENLKRRY